MVYSANINKGCVLWISFCVFFTGYVFSLQDTRITLHKTHTETSTGAQAHTIWMRGALIQRLYSLRFNSMKCQHNRMLLPCPPKLWQRQARRSRRSMVTEQYVAIVCILECDSLKDLGCLLKHFWKKVSNDKHDFWDIFTVILETLFDRSHYNTSDSGSIFLWN